jgi:hypothetical protein
MAGFVNSHLLGSRWCCCRRGGLARQLNASSGCSLNERMMTVRHVNGRFHPAIVSNVYLAMPHPHNVQRWHQRQVSVVRTFRVWKSIRICKEKGKKVRIVGQRDLSLVGPTIHGREELKRDPSIAQVPTLPHRSFRGFVATPLCRPIFFGRPEEVDRRKKMCFHFQVFGVEPRHRLPCQS